MIERTGCDGVMIGRGAYGRPWLLGQVMRWLATGEVPDEPGLNEQYDVMTGHYEHMLSHYGKEAGVRIARKHLGWYIRGVHGAAELRHRLNSLEDPAAVLAALEAFYAPLLDRQAA